MQDTESSVEEQPTCEIDLRLKEVPENMKKINEKVEKLKKWFLYEIHS